MQAKRFVSIILLFLLLLVCIFPFYTIVSADANPPTIIITFAGNLSDDGHPFWRPPGESTMYFTDGYYTNDSRQHEDFIYITATINDTDGVDEVWLHWLNGTTWNNNTWQFINTGGDFWEFNSSGNITTCEGYNYSFDIWANDTLNNIKIESWNKTTLGSTFWVKIYTRRFVQLNCTQINISYQPYYFYEAEYGNNDRITSDRLHHDQDPDGTLGDTGFLKNILPGDNIGFRFCGIFHGFWFEDSTCIEPITLTNIYYHKWLSSASNSVKQGWYKTNKYCQVTQTEYFVNSTPRSFLYYDNSELGISNNYNLSTGLLQTTPTVFTDNDIYELLINFRDTQLSTISNRSFTSFVLFNVPDNATLNASYPDSDGDTLSDWTELYQTYTNPFLSDTDNDGINDYWENASGSDPNNWTETYNTSAVAPIVITNESTNVEETTATINGFLSDFGELSSTCYFLWDIVSPPVANNESQGIIANATEFSKGLTGLTKGELYYFDTKAKNLLGWDNSGGILTFLTKPDEPTNLQLVNETGQVNVTWTVGTGSDKTVIVRKLDFLSANRFDGTEIYNGTGNQHTDIAVSVGNHYYYRAWSYCSEGGLFQFSDDSDQADTVAANPALFDVRDIAVTDNIVQDMQIYVTVENVGDLADDVTMVWTLKRVDTDVLLDAGADTFAVTGHSEVLYAITPSTTYVGLVNITFTADGDATASETFYTQSAISPGGPGYTPPTPPDGLPDEIVPPAVVEAGLPLPVLLFFVAVAISIIFFTLWTKERNREKHKGHETKRGLRQDQQRKSQEPHEIAYRKQKRAGKR